MDSNKGSDIDNIDCKNDQPCIELRFLIPSKVAGSIIGKSGENIKNLRRLFMAKVNISDNSGPERILSLEAGLKSILDILRHSLDRIELPGSGSGDNDNHVDLRMLINQSLVGALIGRGGGRINDLRETCALHLLKVYQDVCPESTDRIVQMIGPISTVLNCIEKVVDFCKDTPVREPKINYDAQNYDSVMSSHYGGWSPNQMRSDMSMNKGGNVTLGFSRPEFNRIPNRQYNSEPFEHNFSANHGEFEGSFEIPQFEQNYLQPREDYQQTIRLPHRVIGAIIGPRGTRIQQIRLESEANITISSPDRNPQDRTILISGSLLNVRRAQQMINECLDKYGNQ